MSRKPFSGQGFLAFDLELIFLISLALIFVSVPSTIIIIAVVFHFGHKTQFTDSDHRLGYVPGPEARGTLDLIWTCVSIIFTCVYISIHIDISNGESREFAKQIRAKYQNRGNVMRMILLCFDYMCWLMTIPVAHKVIFMVFNIFAPESIVFLATLERLSARDGVIFMRSCGQPNWTTKLAFFADMGGFELEKGEHLVSGREFFEWFERIRKQKGAEFELNVVRIEKDINDRSKQDTLVKLFTVCQASWLLIQCAVRLAEGRAVSELEVTTCAFIVCSVITYLCWLHKPYDVQGRITLRDDLFKPHSVKEPDNVTSAIMKASSTSTSVGQPYAPIPLADEETNTTSSELPTRLDNRARFTPLNRAFFDPLKSWLIACGIFSLAGILIGAIHAIPLWNTEFINTTGQWLWRSCCLIQIIVTICGSIAGCIEYRYQKVAGRIFPLTTFIAILFGFSRICIFVLVVVSFWSLPESVYTDIDWSLSAFPHFH
ncbi:hypothetical protein QCA50_007505 [Cerrena zonata]|uniref:Uncharacterized protein n=1 Tax=Cerrena zonata TaxID=2478898 RepID=A0AAW0GH85_9APHY